MNVNTTVKCHQQDNAYYCGVASAQMVLDRMGKGLIDQNTLYNISQNHDNPSRWSPDLQSKWGMDPDRLRFSLNYYTMASGPGIFSVYEETDAYRATSQIVSSFINNKIPVPVLTLGDLCHWMIVRGVKVSSNKHGSSSILYGLYINDPWPPSPSACNIDITTAPPPHDASDKCGSGEEIECDGRYYSYGKVCNSYIPFYGPFSGMWLDTYFKGCDFTGTGVKEFVSICNTEKKVKIDNINKWGPKWEPITLLGESIVDIEKIGDLATADMERHDLYNDKAFSSALKNAKPSRSVLVQRLDLPDSYYYMVPMKSEKAVTAMVLADGMNGSLQGCTAFKTPLKRPFLSREQALERILDKTIDLGNKAGTIKFREGTFSSHPVLVWKPCRESLSPYYPFHMFTSGDKHVYVGHNGRIFTELHDKGPVG